MTVASLLAGEGARVVKTEDGQMQIHVYEEGSEPQEGGGYYPEETEEAGPVFAEAGAVMEGYSDSSQSMPELEHLQRGEGGTQGSQDTDLVSLALHTSKVGEDEEEDWEDLAERNQLTDQQREELLDPPSPSPLDVNEELQEANSEEFPDEIECQLIQKNVLINGQIQSIDFIMCNQCPRLFRTESLLWNHIKAKHKRRTYRRTQQPQMRRSIGGLHTPGLEPGEIHPASIARLEQQQQARREGSNDRLRPGGEVISGGSPPDRTDLSLYVVGLEREQGADRLNSKSMQPLDISIEKPEKYQRQRAKKRIYVDSSHGPFKCPGCDSVTFTNRRALDLHMRKIHKAGIVECDECGRKVLDLKRHKEILHKRFKIYSCPHCSDKYCTQEDLERHLMKVEKNNIVKGLPTPLNPVALPLPLQGAPTGAPNNIGGSPTIVTPGEEVPSTGGEGEKVSEGISKEMEAKTYSCSECGLKTPSRMTYIQHVLNGCIMDMVMGPNDSTLEESSQGTLKQPGRRPGRPPAKKMKIGDVGQSISG